MARRVAERLLSGAHWWCAAALLATSLQGRVAGAVEPLPPYATPPRETSGPENYDSRFEDEVVTAYVSASALYYATYRTEDKFGEKVTTLHDKGVGAMAEAELFFIGLFGVGGGLINGSDVIPFFRFTYALLDVDYHQVRISYTAPLGPSVSVSVPLFARYLPFRLPHSYLRLTTFQGSKMTNVGLGLEYTAW